MGLAIGVDIGGTKIAGGVVDETGAILAQTRRDTPSTDPEAIADAVAAVVRELCVGRVVESVGIGAAGFVDVTRSVVLFAPNLAWRDAPLRQAVETRTGMPVIVENDANAAAWGEFRFGGAEDVDDAVLVTVGTGVGGGVIVGGQLTRGAHGVGGELGHMRVVREGLDCGCGNKGCWEQYASGRALIREARALIESGSPLAARLLELAGQSPANLRGPMVTQAAKEGDQAAVELLAQLGQWLVEGIASLAAVLDPSVFVVGGGVSEAGDLLLEPARTAMRHHLPAGRYRPEPDIRQATLGNDAGMVGAADLARMT